VIILGDENYSVLSTFEKLIESQFVALFVCGMVGFYRSGHEWS